MIIALLQTTAQENMRSIRPWIDAHNRQDMKALDYLDENIEIIEIPSGVVYKGSVQLLSFNLIHGAFLSDNLPTIGLRRASRRFLRKVSIS